MPVEAGGLVLLDARVELLAHLKQVVNLGRRGQHAAGRSKAFCNTNQGMSCISGPPRPECYRPNAKLVTLM
jgi:hypothetical protein